MGNIFTFDGGMLSLLGMIIVYLGNKYLVPFLRVEKNRRYAEWIGHLADEITDDLLVRYPENKWMKYLDESVDRLMRICGIEKSVAKRAINSAMKRKENMIGD